MQMTGISLKNCLVRLQRTGDGRIFEAWIDERRGSTLVVHSPRALEIREGQLFVGQIQDEETNLLVSAVLESVEPLAAAPTPSYSARPRSTKKSEQVPAVRFGFRIRSECVEGATTPDLGAIAVTVRAVDRQFEVLALAASERSLDLTWPKSKSIDRTVKLSVHTLLGVIHCEADVAEVGDLLVVEGYLRVRVQPTGLDVLDAARWHALLGTQSKR